MIPRDYITEWRAQVPWVQDIQVEQDLALYQVGGQSARVPADRRLLVVIAHLVWLAMLIGGVIGMAVTSRRRHVRQNFGAQG